MDLSLDISEADPEPGPLGLRGWVMKPATCKEEGPSHQTSPAVKLTVFFGRDIIDALGNLSNILR